MSHYLVVTIIFRIPFLKEMVGSIVSVYQSPHD